MKQKALYKIPRKHPGMYPEQFWLLEKGDIIRGVKWNGHKGGYRKILGVTKRQGRTEFIELLKLVPSWTKSPYTLYDSNTSQHFLPVKVRNQKIWDLTYERIVRIRERNIREYQKRKVRETQMALKRLERRLKELKKKR